MSLHQRYQIKLILIQSLMSSNIKNEETVSEYNPYIIAHRGYCSLFPENSLQSIEAAIHKCHYVEFDILLTKDNEIVIFHDRYLSKLTNVSAMGEFEARKSLFADDAQKQEEEKVDWWVKDFTKDQLKRLEISQKVSKRPQLRRLKFTIPTLDEAIEEILYVKQQHIQQNTSGFLIQIKCAQEHKEGDQRDTIFAQKLIKCLQNHGLATSQQCKQKNFPIILQSFNHNFLKMMNESQLQLPLVHLYDKVQITKEFLDTHMFPKSIGIAISIRHATKQIMELCASKNLSVFFWTMKDDQPEHLPPLTPTFKHAYDFLFSLRMNGIITEFPQKCEEYLSIFNAAQKAKLNS